MHKFYYNSAFGHSVFYSHYTTLVVTVLQSWHGNDCIVCNHNVSRVYVYITLCIFRITNNLFFVQLQCFMVFFFCTNFSFLGDRKRTVCKFTSWFLCMQLLPLSNCTTTKQSTIFHLRGVEKSAEWEAKRKELVCLKSITLTVDGAPTSLWCAQVYSS